MRGRGGVWMKAIGGFVGGFFFGAAVWAATQIWNPRAVSNGLIDNLATWSEGVVGGAAGGN